MVKLGLIAFANDGGLGAQTRRLAHMLKPDRIMVVNSSAFSRNTAQHYEWYKDFNYFIVDGFPNNDQVQKFLPGLTHVLCVENPYNFGLVYWGQKQGTKIICQTNWEFCDNLQQPWLPVPDKFLMPSFWKLDEMEEMFGKQRVEFLPPPIDTKEFADARIINFSRKSKPVRLLHIIGTAAMVDRNGTLDLLDSLPQTTTDFELVIKSQHPLSVDVFLDDKRVFYEVDNIKDNNDLYKGFDILVLPRRWGGLSLTINEAMMSGLPVITTDISPNNQWLPKEWLVEAELKGTFTARKPVQYYSANHKALAEKIDTMVKLHDYSFKKYAFELAKQYFSPKNLMPRYLNLFNDREA